MRALGTQRLLLEPLAERHLEAMLHIDGDPEVMRFLTGGPPSPGSEFTAAVLAVRVGFDDLGASRVWARTMAVNGRSRRVLERLGLHHTWTAHLHWNERTRTPTPGIIRAAMPSDLPGIRHTYLRSWCAGYAHLLAGEELDREARRRAQDDWHDWEGAIDTTGTDGDRHVAVATDAMGRTLGVVEVALQPAAGEPEVTMLYVEPGAWGTGVATMLLRAGTHWLAEHGATSVRLFTAERPTRARNFYDREGWVPDAAASGTRTGLFPLACYRRVLAEHGPSRGTGSPAVLP